MSKDDVLERQAKAEAAYAEALVEIAQAKVEQKRIEDEMADIAAKLNNAYDVFDAGGAYLLRKKV